MRPAEDALPLRHAVALGLLQGPSELLPISSSAHTALVPWLAGWPYGELDARARKSFELALHTGAGLALALEMRGELRRDAKALDRPRLAALALAIAPAALAGADPAGDDRAASRAARARSPRGCSPGRSRWRSPTPPRPRGSAPVAMSVRRRARARGRAGARADARGLAREAPHSRLRGLAASAGAPRTRCRGARRCR